MTKRSLIHIYIIITCLILAVGAAVGTVCHFVSNGFFNYGADYASGAEVTVNYSLVDYSQEDVEAICESAFEGKGLNGYEVSASESEGYLVYSFSKNTDADTLGSAVEKINSDLAASSVNEYSINKAAYQYYDSLVTNSTVYIWCAVAAAIAIAVQAVYIAIRYRIDMGAVSILTNVNSLLLLAAVLAITRIPFGTYVVMVAVLCLLLSMISAQLFFSKVRSNIKDEDMSKLSPEERIAQASASSSKKIAWLCGAMLVVSVVYAVAALIATFSISAIAPALAAVCACVVSWFSTALLTPSLYSCIRGNKADKKAKKSNKAN